MHNTKPLSLPRAFLIAVILSGSLAGAMFTGCTTTGSGSTVVQPPTPPAVELPNPPGVREE